jgi:tRNA A64-2'-O-ribosylphosphate transferase
MEEELRHREIDIPGGLTLFLGNHQPSITSVLRAVKRAEHGILNCIASIVHDCEFVHDVATAFTPFPLLPNLRCGLWYAPAPATAGFTDTCYFKSTDGHSGEWSFSTARLNLHVAQIAALHGGVCIVDATRRGKSFPVRRKENMSEIFK